MNRTGLMKELGSFLLNRKKSGQVLLNRESQELNLLSRKAKKTSNQEDSCLNINKPGRVSLNRKSKIKSPLKKSQELSSRKIRPGTEENQEEPDSKSVF